MVRAFISERYLEITYIGLSFCAAGLNYLVYPLILRLLESGNASDGISILNISSQIGGLFTISTILSMYATTLKDGETRYLHSMRSYLNVLFVITLLILIASSQELKNIIDSSTLPTFAGVAALSYVSVIAGGWMGTLNAHRKFIVSGLFLLGASFMQLLISYVTVKYFYPSVNGIIISFLVGYMFPFIALLLHMRTTQVKLAKHTLNLDRKLIRGIVASFLVYLALWYAQSFELYIALRLPDAIKDDYIAATIYPKTIFFIGFIYIWTVVPRLIKLKQIPFSQIKRVTLQLFTILAMPALIFASFSYILNSIISGRELQVSIVDLCSMLLFKSLFTLMSLYYVLYLSRGKYMSLIMPSIILIVVMSVLINLESSFFLTLSIASMLVLFITSYFTYNVIYEKPNV